MLVSRIEDTVDLCDKRGYAHFLGFLDEGEQATVLRTLQNRPYVKWRLYGGYKDAERCFLGVFPSYMEPDTALFPIETVAFFYRKERSLSHRDFLGTFMSQGVRREAIGDILCGEGYTVAFLKEDVTTYLCEQIDKIGGEGVRIVRDYAGELPLAHTFVPLRDTVSSPRLDAVVKALIRCSREQASVLIRTESVSVNHRVATSVSITVKPDTVLSVRGHGRFIVDEIGPETKKGRLHFAARKYV